MLTDEDIKKLIRMHHGKAVAQGKVYKVPKRAAAHDLQQKARDWSIEQLESHADTLEEEQAKLEAMLRELTAKLTEQEVLRIQTGVKTKDWLLLLNRYIETRNKLRLNESMQDELTAMISGEPSPTLELRKGEKPKRPSTKKELHPEEGAANEMIQKKETWALRFQGGPEVDVIDRIGFHILARLLESPSIDVPVLDLYQLPSMTGLRRKTHGRGPTGRETADPKVFGEEEPSAPESGDRSFLSENTIDFTTVRTGKSAKISPSDAKGMREYRATLAKNIKKLKDPKLPKAERARLLKENTNLEKTIKEYHPKANLAAPERRPREAARKAVNEAIAAIGKQDPDLEEHLATSIHFIADNASYDPKTPIRWAITLTPSRLPRP